MTLEPGSTMHLELPIGVFAYPDTPLPAVWTFEQVPSLPALELAGVEEATRAAVDLLVRDARLREGARVAVGVGSRGLDHLPEIVRVVVGRLKALGARPFLVPAMGSHGGATAEGQQDILRGYGITPEEMGAEIVSCMETVSLGALTEEEAPGFDGQVVWCDRHAASADAVILVNRIKPHTDFSGDLESGIAKMCAIGLGKRDGASAIHAHGAHGLRHLMGPVARRMASRIPLLGGVALIENEQGRTSEIHGLCAGDVAGARERELVIRARGLAPSLPFPAIDVLVVDLMGKDISGTGLDTHVIGRAHMPSIREETWGGPAVRVLAVLDLTPVSHGNALGLGLADLTTRRLVEKVDWRATFINLQTSREGGVLRGRIPWILPDAESCVRAAVATCGRSDPAQVRLVRVRDTAHVQWLEVSQALLPEALQASGRLEPREVSHPLDPARPLGGLDP